MCVCVCVHVCVCTCVCMCVHVCMCVCVCVCVAMACYQAVGIEYRMGMCMYCRELEWCLTCVVRWRARPHETTGSTAESVPSSFVICARRLAMVCGTSMSMAAPK